MIKPIKLGEVLKNRRTQLGISRELLCESIGFEVNTLYRIENGDCIPSKEIADSLLQKLDLTDEKSDILLNKSDFAIQELQNEIVALNAQKDFAKALERIQELEGMCKNKDKLLSQFILRSRLVAGKLENGTVKPYSNDEHLKTLSQIILISVKHFDIDHIANCFLSFEDAKIINQIAITYSDLGERRRAISIYRQLLEYTEKHYTPSKEMAPILILTTYNYSSQLGLTDRYEKAVEIAQKGYECCVKFGKARLLGQLLYNIAYALYYLGKLQESKDKCYDSYYVLRTMRECETLKSVKAFAEEKFNIRFD